VLRVLLLASVSVLQPAVAVTGAVSGAAVLLLSLLLLVMQQLLLLL
jgi:hypothetical protein